MSDIRVDRSLLVTDFDGTVTRRQFYQLVWERLTPSSTPDFWIEYRAGRITHFEALQRCFAAAEGGEEAFISLLDEMQIESDLAGKVGLMKSAGWDVVVVSAGCSWYVERLLANAKVELPLFANYARIVDGRLIMELTPDRPFFSSDVGLDKAQVVQSFKAKGRRVGFAGDGFPDLEAALAVPAEFRFARSDLAEALQDRGQLFRRFNIWSDIVTQLVNGTT